MTPKRQAYVYLNSRLLPVSAAMVPIFDRGFAFGDALIETLKVVGGRPVFFDDHYQRLHDGIRVAGFGAHLEAEGLRNQAVSLASENGVTSGRLRILLSRGTPPAPAGIDPGEGLTPTLLLTIEGFEGYHRAIYEEGVSCVTVDGNRGRFAHLKSTSLMASVLAREEARAVGAFEAIFTSGHGRLLEGSVSNIFFYDGEKLMTAPESMPILPGVTRQKVLDIAGELGIAVDFAAPNLTELVPEVHSACLTGSVLGVCPIKDIDGMAFRLDANMTARFGEKLLELEQASLGS